MRLTKEEIQHIANLARLNLSEKEIEIYSKQLSAVLEHIALLQEVDTDGVEPTAQVTGLSNVLREDKVEEWDKDGVNESLRQAPEMKGGWVKVRRVLN